MTKHLKRPKWMDPHVLDDLDANRLREKLVKKKIFFSFDKRYSEEQVALRKRIGKLRKIISIEHEACGEEDW